MSRSIQRRFPDGQVTFIGHSLGGVLALFWAVQHASRVSAIILLNTPLGESRDDVTRSLLAARFGWATLLLKHPRLAKLLCISLRGGHLIHLFRFMKPRWVPNAVFRDYCHHTWNSLSRTFDQVLLGMPGAPLVRQISGIPILNLTGQEDDEISRRRTDQSNVENVALPGGHLMLLEHPEPTIRAIEEFLMRART
jgi:pimeloyl-ACP methyl ester carboxylesterase